MRGHHELMLFMTYIHKYVWPNIYGYKCMAMNYFLECMGLLAIMYISIHLRKHVSSQNNSLLVDHIKAKITPNTNLNTKLASNSSHLYDCMVKNVIFDIFCRVIYFQNTPKKCSDPKKNPTNQFSLMSFINPAGFFPKILGFFFGEDLVTQANKTNISFLIIDRQK